MAHAKVYYRGILKIAFRMQMEKRGFFLLVGGREQPVEWATIFMKMNTLVLFNLDFLLAWVLRK